MLSSLTSATYRVDFVALVKEAQILMETTK